MNKKVMHNHRHSAYRRRKNGGKTSPGGGVLIFGVAILLALGLRFSPSDGARRLREDVSRLFDGRGYKEAVATIGKMVSGESEPGENAILVFGKKILGIEEKIETTPQSEPHMPPEAQKNVFEESTPMESVAEEMAGEISGFSFEAMSVSEAPFPIFIEQKPQFTELDTEDTEDTTPNKPFVIPSPDIVDDKKYTLSFPFQTPLKGRITSYFGYRIHPISGETTFHHGADVAAQSGSRVNAFAAGKVIETGYSNVYGNYMKVQHKDGIMTFYAHLSKRYVKKNANVKKGQKIAAVGSTGYSTGPHLHFEVRRNGKILNPFHYVAF